MPEPEWKAIRALLEAALEHPADERSAFVRHSAGAGSPVEAEVLRLLAIDQGAQPDFLNPPTASSNAGPGLRHDSAPESVGPWSLLRPIGAGGMGSVWLARRSDGAFERLVAIKLLHAGAPTPELLARFERERRVLASIDHPGIARLLDGGVTDNGRPWLAMEYVEGVTLDRYADERGLTIGARIDVLRHVCEAVHAAHQARIIHRDLKPANVLVTSDGRPKLLDFGIAKVLDPIEAASHLVTLDGTRLMTPAYASPEQLRSDPVTPASDVYSLGVMLYEQLSGHLPHDVSGRSPAEIERLVSTDQPDRPSRAAGMPLHLPPSQRSDNQRQIESEQLAQRRTTTVNSLRKTLAGDLDMVTLRALAKDPARRYASARDLADDLGRWREGLPVQARPDSLTYRTRRFVSRHRTVVALTGLVLTSQALGLAASLWYARRAETALLEQERLRAEALEDMASLREGTRMLFHEIHTNVLGIPGASVAVDRMLRAAIRLTDRNDDPILRAELAKALALQAEIQAGFYGQGASDLEAAGRTYGRALTIARGGFANDDRSARSAHVLVSTLVGVAGLHVMQGDTDAARLALTEAEQILDSAPEPGDRRELNDLAMGRIQVVQRLARLQLNSGQLNSALDYTREHLALITGESPLFQSATAGVMEGSRAEAIEMLGTIALHGGDFERALESTQDAINVYTVLAQAHPANVAVSGANSTLLSQRATLLLCLNRPTEALREMEPILETLEANLHKEPRNVLCAYDVASANKELAAAHLKARDIEGARRAIARALEVAYETAPRAGYFSKLLIGIELVAAEIAEAGQDESAVIRHLAAADGALVIARGRNGPTLSLLEKEIWIAVQRDRHQRRTDNEKDSRALARLRSRLRSADPGKHEPGLNDVRQALDAALGTGPGTAPGITRDQPLIPDPSATQER